MKFVWSLGLAAVLLSRATPAATYYVSPSGVDTSGNRRIGQRFSHPNPGDRSSWPIPSESG